MAENIRHLRQVNTLVAASDVGELSGAGRDRPYVVVPNLYVGPERPDALGDAACRVFRRYYRGPGARLSDLGTLAALLGGVGDFNGELFSFLFFDGRSHAELIDMGRRDAGRAVAAGWQ